VTLTIRFATSRDAETVLRFIKGLAEYEREASAVEVTADSLREQMESRDPPFECLLAEYESLAVGFALFYRTYSTWRGRPGIYLEDLFVVEEHRGRGVGEALVRRLGEIVIERGWARMEWAVLNWNTTAQAFYRGLGARPLSDWTTWRLEAPRRKLGE
jgi:GNAT superfamily N-acetyltransferase